MEHRNHPTYSRNVFRFTFILFALAMGCLVAGRLLREFNLHTVAGGLEFASAIVAVLMLISWFSVGEWTRCPNCGRRIGSAEGRDKSQELTFTCGDCGIEWHTGGLHDA